MIRAVLFDFYGVWTPDIFSKLTVLAAKHDPAMVPELEQVQKKYYFGLANMEATINGHRRVLKQLAPPAELFGLNSENISAQLVDTARYLHSHFLKVGVLANLGWREYELLKELNTKYQLFESITVSLDVGESVLNKDAFVQALQSIGEPPQSCLVITDNEAYSQFAKDHGLHVLGFQDVPTFKQDLDSLMANNQT